MTDVRLPVRIKGRRHTNRHKINFVDFAEVGCSGKHTILNKHFQVGVGNISDIIAALIDRIGFLFLDIETNGLKSGLGHLYCQRQADIAKTYDSCNDFPIGNFLQ